MKPFLSPKTLLNRAHQHVTEFDAWLLAYRRQNPYKIFSERDVTAGKTTHKARVTEPPPLILSAIAFDAINCARSALDHAVFDASRELGGNPRPKHTKFPFGSDAGLAARDLNRKYSEVPPIIRPFLQGFRPYPEADGGNQTLWGLNEVRNEKIHQILISMISKGGATGVNLLRSGAGHFAVRSDWNPEKQEFTFLEIGGSNEIPLDVRITIEVAFSHGTAFAGKPASASLKQMLLEAHRIVLGIEAETVRLNSIKD